MNLFKSIKPWEIKKKMYQHLLRVTDLENVMLCVQILLVNPERKTTVSVFLRTDFMENEWGVDLLLMTGSLNLQC